MMYRVVKNILNSGERLPILVDERTGVPVKVANRFAINLRRKQVQSSTLRGILFSLGLVYKWADEIANIDLDKFILEGNIIDIKQINSLADYIRVQKSSDGLNITSAGTYNNHLSNARDFLVWSLSDGNRGGKSFLNLQDLFKNHDHITRIFNSHLIPGNHSISHEPLSEDEIERIYKIIKPEYKNGELVFPKENNFKTNIRLRNFLMFEFGLKFGMRKGEILKSRLDCLPRGASKELKILRFPDDPADPRNPEPNVKGAERLYPIPDEILNLIRIFLTSDSCFARKSNGNPYLFLSSDGAPLSIASADDVIKRIGILSSVKNLCWHRLRHTWAEETAELLFKIHNNESKAKDILQYLGGWRNFNSPHVYIKHALAKQSLQYQRQYQQNLYK